jgi:hypothetical protein
MAEKTKSIAFRLPLPLAARLETRAKEEKVTVSEFICRLVVPALEDRHDDPAQETTVRDGFSNLEEMLARITVVLLTDAGHAELEEAEGWVDEFLREQED